MPSCPLVGKIRIKQKKIYPNSLWEKTKREKLIVITGEISRHLTLNWEVGQHINHPLYSILYRYGRWYLIYIKMDGIKNIKIVLHFRNLTKEKSKMLNANSIGELCVNVV